MKTEKSKLEAKQEQLDSELSEGYYWVRLKDDGIVKTSNFLQNSGGWLIGLYMNGYILVNGFPYKLEKFEIDYKKIERYELPDGEIAISSKALTDPNWTDGQTD